MYNVNPFFATALFFFFSFRVNIFDPSSLARKTDLKTDSTKTISASKTIDIVSQALSNENKEISGDVHFLRFISPGGLSLFSLSLSSSLYLRSNWLVNLTAQCSCFVFLSVVYMHI